MSAISMFEKMEGFTSDIYTEQRELNIAIKSNTNAVSKNTNQSKASTKEAEKILDLRPQKQMFFILIQINVSKAILKQLRLSISMDGKSK